MQFHSISGLVDFSRENESLTDEQIGHGNVIEILQQLV